LANNIKGIDCDIECFSSNNVTPPAAETKSPTAENQPQKP